MSPYDNNNNHTITGSSSRRSRGGKEEKEAEANIAAAGNPPRRLTHGGGSWRDDPHGIGGNNISAGSVANQPVYTGHALTTGHSRGGALCFEHAGTVKLCSFKTNSARYGGAVDFRSDGTVTSCLFKTNTATDVRAPCMLYVWGIATAY